MTGEEVRDYIVRRFKRPDKDTDIYESLTDVIMEMNLVFYSQKAAQEAFTDFISEIGDYKLPLPVDFGHIIGDITAVDNTNGETWTVRKISKEAYDELYGDRLFDEVSRVDKEKPRHFCVYAEQIFLGPVPDNVEYIYQINYTTEEATVIEADTASVKYSDRYRRCLRYGVLADLYAGMSMDEEAAKWQAYYDREIDRIVANDDTNTDGTSQNATYHGI